MSSQPVEAQVKLVPPSCDEGIPDDNKEVNASAPQSAPQYKPPRAESDNEEVNIDPSQIKEKIVAKYNILDTNTFGLARATISILDPGIYRGVYKNYDWQLLKEIVVWDEIIITSETSKKIVKQIQEFWNMGGMFKDNGLLHKRGFLLTGKPGCGKSSIITAVIADAIKNDCIVFLPSSREVGEDLTSCLKKIKTVEPNKKVLIILEDFECYLENNSAKSRWLNILDGAEGHNNVVYLATSNYPEQIDQRFTTRPSRFDTVYIIDCPSFEDRVKYIRNKKMNITEEVAYDIAKQTEGMSYAHIKEYLISTYLFKLDPTATLQRMLNQEAHPISSQDFEEKRCKLGFEGPSKKQENDKMLAENEVEFDVEVETMPDGRQVFKIDVGNISPEEAAEFVENAIKQVEEEIFNDR